MSLHQLKIFSAVARRLSFSKAAKDLHLSAPAVSMQIRELERIAGLPLLERNRGGVSITEAGLALLRAAKDIDERIHEVQQVMDSMRGKTTGSLRIGAIETAMYFVSALIMEFNAKYPDVTVRFDVGRRAEIYPQLLENELDFVLAGRPHSQMNVIGEAFAKHPFVIIASADHPLAGKRISPSSLASEWFLTREEDSGTKTLMNGFLKEIA